MALSRFLREASFDDDAVRVMAIAFEDMLRELRLTDRLDPLVEIVARIIIECATKGDRDPAGMRNCVLQAIRNSPPRVA